MAKFTAKHKARRGDIKKNKHQAENVPVTVEDIIEATSKEEVEEQQDILEEESPSSPEIETVTEELTDQEAPAEESLLEEMAEEEPVSEEAVTEEATTEEAVSEDAVAEESVAQESIPEEKEHKLTFAEVFADEIEAERLEKEKKAEAARQMESFKVADLSDLNLPIVNLGNEEEPEEEPVPEAKPETPKEKPEQIIVDADTKEEEIIGSIAVNTSKPAAVEDAEEAPAEETAETESDELEETVEEEATDAEASEAEPIEAESHEAEEIETEPEGAEAVAESEDDTEATSEEPVAKAEVAPAPATEKEENVVVPPPPAPATEYSKPKKSKGKIAGIVVLVLLLLTGLGYGAERYVLSPDHFQSGSTINGVDVAGLTDQEAKDKVVSYINQGTLNVTQDGDKVGSISGFKFDFNYGNKITEALHPSLQTQFMRLFDKSRREYIISDEVLNKDKKFNKQFKKLSIVKNKNGTKKTKNAYVDMSNTDFNIVDEVIGDSIDTKKLKEAMIDQISENNMAFDYVPSHFYEVPTITADSKEIQDQLEYCKKYLTQKITLDSLKGKYTIEPAQLNKVIQIDENGNRTILKKKVKKLAKYLNQKLSSENGLRRVYLAGVKKKVSVNAGDYVVNVDEKAEYKQLLKDLEAGQDTQRRVNYTREINWDTKSDIGDDYVEISISKQHLWVVKNGKVKVSTAVVTGNVAEGYGTPTGVYALKYKESPSTLKGTNADGSKYESKVNYWMPFNGDVGCHDASWRSSFGGSIYRSNGSHGCVNMPRAGAASMYKLVEPGIAVIVHN